MVPVALCFYPSFECVDWKTDVSHRQERVWSETNWHQLFLGISRQRQMCSKWSRQVSWLTAALLLCHGDVQPNPGPPAKYPCGRCSRAVKQRDKGILCDGCELWYHCSCVYLDMAEYRRLGSSDDPWYCPRYVFPPLSHSYFDSSCSSIHSDNVLDNDSEMENVSVPFLNM